MDKGCDNCMNRYEIDEENSICEQCENFYFWRIDEIKEEDDKQYLL